MALSNVAEIPLLWGRALPTIDGISENAAKHCARNAVMPLVAPHLEVCCVGVCLKLQGPLRFCCTSSLSLRRLGKVQAMRFQSCSAKNKDDAFHIKHMAQRASETAAAPPRCFQRTEVHMSVLDRSFRGDAPSDGASPLGVLLSSTDMPCSSEENDAGSNHHLRQEL